MLRRLVLLSLMSSMVAGLPARAEWLVTIDGQEIETSGPWKVRRHAAYFHLPDGTYSSLPRSSVDLESSRRLTQLRRNASNQPSSEPAPPRASVLRITDDDVGHISNGTTPHVDTANAPKSASTDADSAQITEPSGAQKLVVLHWERTEPSEDSDVVITGEIQNAGRTPSEGIELRVDAFGEDGTMTSSSAKLAASTLKPGQTTRFKADMHGVTDYERVEFSLDSQPKVASASPETR